MSVTSASEPASTKRLLRSIGVLLVFAVAGPALGGLLVFCAVYSVVMLFGVDPANVPTDQGTLGISGILGMLSLFVAMAFAFGGPQAVMTGAWAGISAWRHGGISGHSTVVVAVIATLAWIAIIYSPLNPFDTAHSDRKLINAMQMALTLMPIGIASALFCRWLARALRLLR